MKLNEPLLNSFELDGIEYDIDCSFDTVLDVFEVFSDDLLNELEKFQVAVEIMTGQHITDALTFLTVWEYIDEHFIKTRKEKPVLDRNGNPMPVPKEEIDKVRLLDIEEDASDIYASFRMAYGINLFEEQGKMTWQEFSALLNGMPDNTPVARLIQIRDWKPKPHDSAEYKANMRKLQNKYRLDREEE